MKTTVRNAIGAGSGFLIALVVSAVLGVPIVALALGIAARSVPESYRYGGEFAAMMRAGYGIETVSTCVGVFAFIVLAALAINRWKLGIGVAMVSMMPMGLWFFGNVFLGLNASRWILAGDRLPEYAILGVFLWVVGFMLTVSWMVYGMPQNTLDETH